MTDLSQLPSDEDRGIAEELDRLTAQDAGRRTPEQVEEEASRSDRLRRRRRAIRQRRQAFALYALAAFVAFAAVIGAWWVGSMLLGGGEEERPAGHLTLLTITGAEAGEPVAAALVVRDASRPRYDLYVIPRELLLEGPNGEYIFAGDSLETGTLQEDLERVIKAKVDASYVIPAEALGELAGGNVLQVELARPVTLVRDGVRREYEDRMVIVRADLADLFANPGSGGYDGTTLQEGLWGAVLDAAARQAEGSPSPLPTGIVAQASGTADRWYLEDTLRGIAAGEAVIARLPSTSRVAEGQFAFVPDDDGIMANITRKRSGYTSKYTVVVRNGSGKVGIGGDVVQALSSLDVNLPQATNADRFDYRQTRIIAGSGALAIAEDVRAILGSGVVLNGADVPGDTVLVIVGDDLRRQDLNPKDQP